MFLHQFVDEIIIWTVAVIKLSWQIYSIMLNNEVITNRLSKVMYLAKCSSLESFLLVAQQAIDIDSFNWFCCFGWIFSAADDIFWHEDFGLSVMDAWERLESEKKEGVTCELGVDVDRDVR